MLINKIKYTSILKEDLKLFFGSEVAILRLYGVEAQSLSIFIGDTALLLQTLSKRQMKKFVASLESMHCEITETDTLDGLNIRFAKPDQREDFSKVSTDDLLERCKLLKFLETQMSKLS